MKRFAFFLFVTAFTLALTKSVDAADKHKSPQAPKPQAAPTEIKVDGKLSGPVKLNQNGWTKLTSFGPGLNVSVQLKNGRATAVQVTDSKGRLVPATVQNKIVDGKTRIVVSITTPSPAPPPGIPIPYPNVP
jgi:hypothetical protein